jgi:hypothetical protein
MVMKRRDRCRKIGLLAFSDRGRIIINLIWLLKSDMNLRKDKHNHIVSPFGETFS